MGNKTGCNWIVVAISPEGVNEWIAESGNVSVARAAFYEALQHRPGRIVEFRHGPQVLDRQTGYTPEQPEPMALTMRRQFKRLPVDRG